MKQYFILQYKMINRKMIDLGLNPFIAYLLLIGSFVGFSIYLFSKTEFDQYIYLLIALGFITKLSERGRNDFLKSIFDKNKYLVLRLLENITISLPFVFFLVFYQALLSLAILVVFTFAMALINFNATINYTIPTPFHKKPFEFTVGFRNTFYLFLIAYFLCFMSVSVGNFNLGIFAQLLVFILSFSFYSKLENEYYVWIHSKTATGFLFEKIKIAFIYTSLLSLPIIVSLGLFFSEEIISILIIQFIAYIYLITIIFAKYSSYPHEMSILQAIIIGISLLFPPLLIGIIPFFFFQSNKRLNNIL